MANILVTGSNGQIGTELQYLAKHFPDFTFTFVDVPGREPEIPVAE